MYWMVTHGFVVFAAFHVVSSVVSTSWCFVIRLNLEVLLLLLVC